MESNVIINAGLVVNEQILHIQMQNSTVLQHPLKRLRRNRQSHVVNVDIPRKLERMSLADRLLLLRNQKLQPVQNLHLLTSQSLSLNPLKKSILDRDSPWKYLPLNHPLLRPSKCLLTSLSRNLYLQLKH